MLRTQPYRISRVGRYMEILQAPRHNLGEL